MNYNEFVDYLADLIVACRHIHPHRPGRPDRFYYAGYKAVLDCRAFFDRFSLDEGQHNDHNPTSSASMETYRAAINMQIADALGHAVQAASEYSNEEFLNKVLRYPVLYGQRVTDRRFAQAAAEHVSNIVFERICAGCGAKYNVALKAQTYRFISNDHPVTCTAVSSSPVQTDKPRLEDKYMSIAEMKRKYNKRSSQRTAGPTIPEKILNPNHKPVFNSPEHRANAQAAFRLYADFLKFYEENPLPESDPEENQRQMAHIFAVTMRTVFNFDSDALKKKQ